MEVLFFESVDFDNEVVASSAVETLKMLLVVVSVKHSFASFK